MVAVGTQAGHTMYSYRSETKSQSIACCCFDGLVLRYEQLQHQRVGWSIGVYCKCLASTNETTWE